MSAIPFETSSGNVFADLGFSPDEAEDLTAKAWLILALKDALIEHGLTLKQAAQRCGSGQATLARILRGGMENVTTDRLGSWLTALSQDAEMTVPSITRSPRGRP